MGTPDIVYPLKVGESNEELRYSLRTLAHIPHGRVWIAGYRPSWVRGVGHIPVVQTGTKYQNSTGNLRAAAEHPDVAEEFLMFNDDFFLMQPMGSMPAFHRGPVSQVEAYYASRARGMYLRGLRETKQLLGKLGHPEPLSYELHVPMPFEKTKVLQMLEVGRGLTVLHKRTLYGNLFRIGGTRIPDPKVITRAGNFNRNSQFLSTMDETFARGQVGVYIRSRFPKAGPYEAVSRVRR